MERVTEKSSLIGVSTGKQFGRPQVESDEGLPGELGSRVRDNSVQINKQS